MMRHRHGQVHVPAYLSQFLVQSKTRRSLLALFFWSCCGGVLVVQSFQPCVALYNKARHHGPHLYSSVGPPGEGRGDGGKFDEFFNPQEESEELFKAREYMNENSLPLSYDYDNTTATGGGTDEDAVENELEADEELSMVAMNSDDAMLTAEKLAQNPYIDIVSKISPSELISKFSTNAHPRVQSAVRNTILGLLGGLPKMAFDTTTVTTGQKLASLMFQLQMTGYMFKVCDNLLGSLAFSSNVRMPIIACPWNRVSGVPNRNC